MVIKPFQKHTIKKAETIASIAKKYEVCEAELKTLNELKSDKDLKEGTQLLLPDPFPAFPYLHAIKDGETLLDISIRYSMDLERLLCLNPKAKSTPLKKGDYIWVEQNS